MVSLTSEEPRRTNGLSPAVRDYLLGIALLLVVVFLWTLSNFITQALFTGGYNKPFLVTYLNTSSFTLYLIPFLIGYWRKGQFRLGRILQNYRGQYEALHTSDNDDAEIAPFNDTHASYTPGGGPTLATNDILDAMELPSLTTRETAHLAAAFCFIWFIANWSLNAALKYTSVTSSTILSSTSGIFTLVMGRLLAVEYLSLVKIIAVFTSFIGGLLVSLSDNSTPVHNTVQVDFDVPTAHSAAAYANPILGDLLAVLSAACYAFYVLLLKIRIRSESRINMRLFFGFVGAFNIIALFPVGILLHLTGYEPFELPATAGSWGGVLFNMFITLSSDFIYVFAMLKTTPVVVTVGLTLTIPLAIIGDQILGRSTKGQAALGAILVLGSFGLLGWENADTARQKGTSDNVEGESAQDGLQESYMGIGDSRRNVDA